MQPVGGSASMTSAAGRPSADRQEHAQPEVVRVVGQTDRPAETVLAWPSESDRCADRCTGDEECGEVVPVAVVPNARPDEHDTRQQRRPRSAAAMGAPVASSATSGPESATDDEECCDGEEPAMWATEEVPNANSVVAMTSRRTESQQRGRRRTA